MGQHHALGEVALCATRDRITRIVANATIHSIDSESKVSTIVTPRIHQRFKLLKGQRKSQVSFLTLVEILPKDFFWRADGTTHPVVFAFLCHTRNFLGDAH